MKLIGADIIIEPNPHHAILQSLYDLYLDNRNDRKTLERISAIAWALSIEYEGAYFELAELIMSHLHNPAGEYAYYSDRIENQLRIFKEHEQGIITERSRQYEADRAAFPDIGMYLSFGLRSSAKSTAIRKSYIVLFFVEGDSFEMRGGTEAIHKLIRDTIKSIDYLDLQDHRYSLEKITKHIPHQTELLELMSWQLVTRENAFSPFQV